MCSSHFKIRSLHLESRRKVRWATFLCDPATAVCVKKLLITGQPLQSIGGPCCPLTHLSHISSIADTLCQKQQPWACRSPRSRLQSPLSCLSQQCHDEPTLALRVSSAQEQLLQHAFQCGCFYFHRSRSCTCWWWNRTCAQAQLFASDFAHHESLDQDKCVWAVC